jgi:RNA polymerase sigma factor (sigma-70 family)
MGLQDGFGDALSSEEMAAVIEANERLLRLKAGERLRGNSSATDVWEDVLQEGRIVQFEVLSKRPGSTREYVSAAMSHRIIEVLTRGTWTGMPTAQGKPRDPLRRGDRDSVDDETLQLDQVVDSSNWVESVQMAYHYGEIHQALAALTFTQRQHVVARIWYGMSEPEIAALQGCSVATVSRHWVKDIRPQLAEELARLA